jgi:WD40 repeat protein
MPLTLPFPPAQFLDLTFSPKGKLLVLRDAKAIHVLSAPAWKHQFSFELASRIATHAPIAFSQDESLFVASGLDGLPELFARPMEQTRPWKSSAKLRSPQLRDATCFRFGGPGGTYLLAGTTDGYLQVWNIARLRQLMNPAKLDWDWPEWKPVDLPPVHQVNFIEPQ